MISRKSLEIGRRKARKRIAHRYYSTNSEVIKKYDLNNPDDKIIGKYRKTTKVCSCSMCCSKRNNDWAKSKRLSMQERKANESYAEEEWDDSK